MFWGKEWVGTNPLGVKSVLSCQGLGKMGIQGGTINRCQVNMLKLVLVASIHHGYLHSVFAQGTNVLWGFTGGALTLSLEFRTKSRGRKLAFLMTEPGPISAIFSCHIIFLWVIFHVYSMYSQRAKHIQAWSRCCKCRRAGEQLTCRVPTQTQGPQ